MNYSDFCNWLTSEKGMSLRSAKDVVSRVKRVTTITDYKEGAMLSTDDLNAAPSFQECSMFVKSQLRRSVVLFNEFLTWKK